ncbi:MAG: PaaI family thioesterase [Candidatus Dormibacteria bacterium]
MRACMASFSCCSSVICGLLLLLSAKGRGKQKSPAPDRDETSKKSRGTTRIASSRENQNQSQPLLGPVSGTSPAAPTCRLFRGAFARLLGGEFRLLEAAGSHQSRFAKALRVPYYSPSTLYEVTHSLPPMPQCVKHDSLRTQEFTPLASRAHPVKADLRGGNHIREASSVRCWVEPSGGMSDMSASVSQVDVAVPVYQEPSRGALPDPRIFLLPGRDMVREGLTRPLPRPPFFHLTGVAARSLTDTALEFEQPASPWFLSSQGVIPGGMLAVMGDFAMGAVILDRLAPRTPFSTSELSMNFIRPATPADGTLVARASHVHAGTRLALSDVRITNTAGDFIAHGTSRCMVSPQRPPLSLGGDAIPDEQARTMVLAALDEMETPTYDSPDPYLRPVRGEVLEQAEWGRRGGLEVLLGQVRGQIPMPPIHHLTGMRPLEAEPGRVVFGLPATPWLTSGIGTVLGGFVALLAYSALASAIQTTVRPGTAHAPVDLKVNFLRPVFPDPQGRDLVATGTVLHRGRNLSVGRAEVVSPEGRTIAIAVGTSMLLSGKAAWEMS